MIIDRGGAMFTSAAELSLGSERRGDMKIVLVRSPKILSGILKKIFDIR